MPWKNRTPAWRTRPLLCLGALLLVLLAAGVASLVTGPFPISVPDVLSALFHPATTPNDDGFHNSAVIWNLRLPRLALGILVGGGLGMAGAALQGLFRNPLADPGLIGVSSGGALGAVLAIVLGFPLALGALPQASIFALPLAAFGGSLIATILVYAFALTDGKVRVATLLLAGIAVNALAAAGIGWCIYMADEGQLRELTFWTLGSLGGANWRAVTACLPFTLIAVILLPRWSGALNALALGESEARHMGYAIEGIKRGVVIVSALAVGATVAFSGIIGFIGLVAPHLFRMAAGADHRWVLPGSFFAGACLLVAADILAKIAVAPAELPIGVVVSTVGAPVFLFLLRSQRERALS